MLTAEGLTCQRGARRLFGQLSFELPNAQWLQIQGANGAGKTTLLRVLAGLVAPQEGSVSWRQQPISANREQWHRDLLYLGHQAALKEELSPLENLTYGLGLEGYPAEAEHLIQSLRRFGLRDREHLPVRYLSAGQRRRVLLTRLLVRPAELWILDEPFTALDVQATAYLATVIEAHLDRGGSAVLTSHQTLGLRPGLVVNLG